MSKRPYLYQYPEARARQGMSLPNRLCLKINATPTGCWLYKGATIRTGYAQLVWRGRPHHVHRLSYETFVGPIPEGLTIDHLCRHRSCFNPDHLQPVTIAENLRRGLVSRGGRRAS